MRTKPVIIGIAVVVITFISVLMITLNVRTYADISGQGVQSGAGLLGANQATASGAGVYSANAAVQSGGGIYNYRSTPNHSEIPVNIAVVDYSENFYPGGKFRYVTNLDFYNTRSVSWRSSNPDVIYVDDKGFATVLSSGATIITATDDQGNISNLVQDVTFKEEESTDTNASQSKPIYGVINDKTGEIVYTTDDWEIDALIAANDGWRIESYVGESGTASDKPVYRLINRIDGRLAYTTDRAKYKQLCEGEWSGEGIVFFVSGEGSAWEIS